MTHGPERPRQAVILAGGRGTRLAPLTNTKPKPMIEFHGKPFLEYLIEMLRDQGFDRVLLLLGYLPDTIIDHFGDGLRFGLRIEYSVTEVEDDTGLRIKKAANRLDPIFLLMYCDNYWPMRFSEMWTQFSSSGAAAQVTVYDNRDGYTRDNLVVEDGFLTVYDKTRTTPGLQGVDIGFLIMRRELIDLLPEGNASFEANLYPRLIEERKLAAYVTRHRYYSVGSHARLPLTENFLARTPTLILDRDGVLNVKMPQARYVHRWSDWRWIDGSLEAIRRLTVAGWRILLVTNQAGIARGVFTEQDLADIHERMLRDIRSAGGDVARIYHCPHGWDDGCDCRKPRPGMLFRAQQEFDLDLNLVYFVGDDERDEEAAARAGCRFVKVSDSAPLINTVAAILEEVSSK